MFFHRLKTDFTSNPAMKAVSSLEKREVEECRKAVKSANRMLGSVIRSITDFLSQPGRLGKKAVRDFLRKRVVPALTRIFEKLALAIIEIKKMISGASGSWKNCVVSLLPKQACSRRP